MPELEGASVEVIQYEEVVANGPTDANGEIQFSLPIGTYFVRVSKNGYITHTYILECLVAKECRILNLPPEPLWIQGLQFSENMGETPAVSNSPRVEQTISLTPKVSLLTEDPIFSLSMSAAAAKNPTTWRLQVVEPSASDGGLTIPADAISPAIGNIDSDNNVSVATIGTTKQFLLYQYSRLDSTVVNDNGATTSEAVGTTHSYTVPAQTLGSRKRFQSYFRKAWEAVVSVDGAGTTNKTGTYEVLEGNTFAVTATANTGHIFLYWTLNGIPVSNSATFTFPAQEPACSHQIVAHFL
ncbi:MAG TPA: carboxypeptidase-like regulatory domain-containing protein [Saprospiraceae bacterium]|nr:carboxypeptidase-like regulatory domain-containing protein [Saprospiraceae bacterium]